MDPAKSSTRRKDLHSIRTAPHICRARLALSLGLLSFWRRVCFPALESFRELGIVMRKLLKETNVVHHFVAVIDGRLVKFGRKATGTKLIVKRAEKPCDATHESRA